MAINLNPIGNPEKVGGFNNNFQIIEDELNDNVLRRDGLSPGEANHMEVSLDMNGNAILNVSTDTDDDGSLINLGTADLRYVRKAGDTMEGVLNMGGSSVTNLPAPTQANEAARKSYVDSGDSQQVSKAGDSMSGNLDMSGNDVTGTRTTVTDNLILGGLPVNAGELSPNQVIWVDTIADLRILDTDNLVDRQAIHVNKYYADTGLGGGEFYWEASSEDDDNGGTVISVEGVTTGRFLRRDLSIISPEMCGAVGDGVTDDSDALTTAFSVSSCKLKGRSDAVYRVTKGLALSPGTEYVGGGATILADDPSGGDYHLISAGSDAEDSGVSDWSFCGWKLKNTYIDNGDGEFRRALNIQNQCERWSVSKNTMEDFYFSVFASGRAGGAIHTNTDGSPQIPSAFTIERNTLLRSLGSAIFIIKGSTDFLITRNVIEDTGGGRLELGFGILIDALSATESEFPENAVPPKNGGVIKNYISKTRQAAVLSAGGESIDCCYNTISEVGFYGAADAQNAIQYGVKFSHVPSGLVEGNEISPCPRAAIAVTGKTGVIKNRIEDATTVGGVAYVSLGVESSPWIDSECKGNIIKRVVGSDVPAISLIGEGSGKNCKIGINHYEGHSKTLQRYLSLTGGSTLLPSLYLEGQMRSGRKSFTGDGVQTDFLITHELDTPAAAIQATPWGAASLTGPWMADLTNGSADIRVRFQTAPDGVFLISWSAWDIIYSIYNE